VLVVVCFFFSSRRRHTRFSRDWSSDVCSSDLGLLRLVRLTGGQLRGQRQPASVAHQMHFGAEPAAAVAQGVIERLRLVRSETFWEAPPAARLARIEVPSTHQADQSSLPSSSSFTASACTMRSNTPVRCQSAK